MEKSQKKQSTNTIRQMPKTKYDKALEFYGLQGKSSRQIATKINYTPTIKIKVKGKPERLQKITDTKSERYVNKVREELLRQYNDDSKEVIGTYSLRFKKYDKDKKKYYKGEMKFNVTGAKRDIDLLAQLKFEERAKELQEEYDEWKDFTYNQSGEIRTIGEKTGSGIDNGKTITTTTGGQRKVGMKGHKSVIKMRDMFSLKFAGDEDHLWDRKEGTCVFDYLYETYRCKGFDGTKANPKTREEGYKWLNEIIREDEVNNPLIDGVSVYQLEKFCDNFKCRMYAFDETEGMIEIYNPKIISKTNEPLIFRVYDGHFNPYPKDKRLSMSSKDNKYIKTNDKEEYANKKTTEGNKKYEIISPTQEEYDAIKEELEKQDYPISIRNKIALNYLKQNGMKIPYPLNDKNLIVNDGSIVKLRYGDKVVLTEPINPRIKRWYEDNNEEYIGDSFPTLLNKIWKDKYGFSIGDAPFLSNYNGEVRNALSSGKIKWRTHLGLTEEGQQYSQDNIIEMINDGKAITVDICKCYCDALYNPRERWLVFNGKEILEEYDGKPLTLGLYFLNTEDMTLLHKSNWYSKQMVMKARQEGISHTITHQIRCVDVIWEKEKYDAEGNTIWKLDNLNLFEPIIDEIVERTEQDEDFTITKMLINSISGYLGKTHYNTKTAAINTKLQDIWENWIVADKDKVISNGEEIYIREIKDENTTLYLYGVEKKIENLSSGLPMYIQILDSANIALYDMIKSVGGTCIYRKTDCIVSIGGKLPEDKIIKYPCNYTDTWGKYRLLDDAENYNYKVETNINRDVEPPKLSDDWIHYDYNDSNDWKFIIEKAIENGGMLVSGRAGTGKSYIIEQGIKCGLLPEEIETRMAPTNRAARNINGTTIHKNLAINGNNKTNSKTIQGLKKYKIFIIDEISMLYGDLWRKLCLLKKETGAIFILLGDFRQCPPIEEGEEMDYFNHPYAKELANNNICELTTPQRYDLPLWNWLEDFYEEGKSDYNVIGKKKLSIEDILYSKNIVFYNDTRKTINELCMKHIVSGMSYIPVMLPVDEKCSNEKSQLTYLYKGLPLMVIANNKNLEIINSEEFIVKEVSSSDSNIVIYSEEDPDREPITIEFKDFHKNFVVNYAATTHKSQGATIEKEINLFDWDRLQKDRRIGYTAVSRAKKPTQVTIVQNYRDWRFNNDKDDVVWCEDEDEPIIDEDFAF